MSEQSDNLTNICTSSALWVWRPKIIALASKSREITCSGHHMRCHQRIKAVDERGKQQEIPAGDKDRWSMGEIEHETDKCVRETERVGDLKDTA